MGSLFAQQEGNLHEEKVNASSYEVIPQIFGDAGVWSKKGVTKQDN